jgi:hypothetical protein
MQGIADKRLFGEKQAPALAGGFRQSNLTLFLPVSWLAYG